MKVPHLSQVDWIDSSHTSGWQHVSQAARLPDLRCRTVGFLIYQDAKVVRVCASIALDGDGTADSFGPTITIPRVAITRIRKVGS